VADTKTGLIERVKRWSGLDGDTQPKKPRAFNRNQNRQLQVLEEEEAGSPGPTAPTAEGEKEAKAKPKKGAMVAKGPKGLAGALSYRG
jgi:hypothetical protein